MRRRALLPFVLFVVAVAIGAGAYSNLARGHGNLECPPTHETVLLVDTGRHQMALCESGRMVREFSVRIGKSGVGKSREGDGKTPLGRYELGEPRASVSYGLFLPIGYPRTEQRKLGFTGGAVGVHGPHRRVRWLGALVNTFDTTDGCVGVATDAEIREISGWVREHRAKEIVLR